MFPTHRFMDFGDFWNTFQSLGSIAWRAAVIQDISYASCKLAVICYHKLRYTKLAADGVEYILANEINETSIRNHINHIMNFIEKVDYIYLTICLDVFDISFAPGVSAPSAIGLHPNYTLDLIKEIVGSGKLISADIAELNPLLDQDIKTSKLASKLAYEIITDF